MPINPPSDKRPTIFEELKPVKIEDPLPTPPAKPSNPGGKDPLNTSDVQIKKIDDNFFGGGGNKKDNFFNGIKFMGSQIQSFNDIPTLHSKIIPGRRPKLPSIPKIGGQGGMISKIFNPNVIFEKIRDN